MTTLKKLLKGITLLVVLLLLFAVGTLWIDANRTSYLAIDENQELANNNYLITNVNIVPMTSDTVLMGKNVLVKRGRIAEIGENLQADDVPQIDGKNGYLTPGLTDMHVHLWDRQDLGVYLANGVTTIRNLRGFPMHLRIKRDIENENIISPLLFTSGPILTGPNDLGDEKIQVADVLTARELVKRQKDQGYDCIKTYAGMPEDIFNTVLQQAEASQIDVVVHPSFEVPYGANFHRQIASVEHAEDIVQQALEYQLDTTILKSVVAQYGASRQTFSPTLTGYHKIVEMLIDDSIESSEQMDYINPLVKKVDSKIQLERWSNEKKHNPDIVQRVQAQHRFHLEIVNQLNLTGVNIICGTDAGIGITAPGFSIHEELGFYREAGMTNYGALKTATINPSRVHRELRDIGTVEIGNRANLLLLDKNPLQQLETLKNPKWVMVNGRKLNPELLQMFKNKAKNRKGIVAAGLRWAEYLLYEKWML